MITASKIKFFSGIHQDISILENEVNHQTKFHQGRLL